MNRIYKPLDPKMQDNKQNSKMEVQEEVREHMLPPAEDSDNETPQSQAKEPEQSTATTDTRDQEIRRLQAERDLLFDRLARQQAEFENLRKRATRDQAEFREYAMADTVKSLLPILDNFDLALRAQDKANANGSDLRKGLELIRKQMDEVLQKLGVQAIPSAGEPFDPRYHEAIEMVESSDAKDNHVVDELQRGYKLKDRLLRPAMVRVAKNPKH
jgi:molecular chaperone GrpE